MNPDDFNDPDVRALAILIPQEIAAAEARGRKQAADDIAHAIELEHSSHTYQDWGGESVRSGLLKAAQIARAYAAGQDTG